MRTPISALPAAPHLPSSLAVASHHLPQHGDRVCNRFGFCEGDSCDGLGEADCCPASPSEQPGGAAACGGALPPEAAFALGALTAAVLGGALALVAARFRHGGAMYPKAVKWRPMASASDDALHGASVELSGEPRAQGPNAAAEQAVLL